MAITRLEPVTLIPGPDGKNEIAFLDFHLTGEENINIMKSWFISLGTRYEVRCVNCNERLSTYDENELYVRVFYPTRIPSLRKANVLIKCPQCGQHVSMGTIDYRAIPEVSDYVDKLYASYIKRKGK